MSKVMLVYPPSRVQYHQSCPMGLLFLASVLEQHGHDIILIDANAASKKMDSDEIVAEAERQKPDIIGMTLLTPMIRESYILSGKLKARGFRLLAGGPHATLVPREPLSKGFDAVVVGEGEFVVHEAVRALMGESPMNSVPGMAYIDERGETVLTDPLPLVKDLDLFPQPARHLVDKANYGGREDGVLHSNMFSSRGCPAKCSFCSGHLFGKKFRFRSAASMVDEIEHLHKTYGTTEFHFVDDAMTMHRRRLYEFCDILLERKLPVTWSIMTRIDAVDAQFLQRIREAGCTQIDYGVESGDPDTLKRIHKPHTVEMVRTVIPLTARMGIKPVVFLILGFPWENAQTLENTLGLIRDIAPYVAEFHPAVASILVPFPGTEIYEQYKDEFQFENWWLSENRNYDTLVATGLSYYESKIFHLGNILKADFFRYNADVKRKIYEIFEFLYKHNLSRINTPVTKVQRQLITVSRQIDAVLPAAERVLFKPVWMAETILKKMR